MACEPGRTSPRDTVFAEGDAAEFLDELNVNGVEVPWRVGNCNRSKAMTVATRRATLGMVILSFEWWHNLPIVK